MSFAQEAARRLDHPVLNNRMGSFLLGSTSPDIRNMTGWDRYDTHFFHLDSDSPGKGIEGLFKHHPELTEIGKLGRDTKSFIAGYMSHLVTDETWIVDVYRPYFGSASSIADDPMRNVIDRVVQFEMDQRERKLLGPIDDVLGLLKESEREVEISFIDRDALRKWREIVHERSSQEMTWEHFRWFARRGLPSHLKDDQQTLDSVVDDVQSLRQRGRSHVPEQVISDFRSQAIDRFVSILGEYLD